MTICPVSGDLSPVKPPRVNEPAARACSADRRRLGRSRSGGDHVIFGEVGVITAHDYVYFTEDDQISRVPRRERGWGYVLRTIDMSAYKGQTVTKTPASRPTSSSTTSR
jgi:hypothetical protein